MGVLLNEYRTPNPTGHRPFAHLAWWRRLALEVGIVASLWIAYNLGRLLASHHTSSAFDNSNLIWRFERALPLPSEEWVQSALLAAWPHGVEIANIYYISVHFPAMLAFLIYTFIRFPAAYLWARRSFVLVTAAALIGHLTFPLAPPRMRPDLGFVDTGHLFGITPYSEVTTDSVANQFAAMPSLHVGWAVLIAVVMISVGRTRWRWLWALHPIITIVVVTVTANHYWFDGLVAIALLIPSMMIARRGIVDPPPWPWKPRVRATPATSGATERTTETTR